VNAKKLIAAFLMLFVLISIGTIIAKETGTPASSDVSAPQKSEEMPTTTAANQKAPFTEIQKPQAVEDPIKVVVYYFHGNFRCATCRKIEALTTEAITTGFAEDIKNGRVVLKVINTEETGNEHYVQDYQLVTKSVVLVRFEGEKQKGWKRLDAVWNLIENDAAFLQMVQEETAALLKGKP